MRRFPKRPTGSDAEALFDQAVWDAVFGPESQLIPSSTVKISNTTRGKVFTADAGGSGGTTDILCVVTSLYYGTDEDGDTYDYIGVTAFDLPNMATTGSEFLCVKSIPAWSPETELIDGSVITYVYSGDNTRVASSDIGANENHVIHPRYLTWPIEDDNLAISQLLLVVSKLKGGTILTASDPDNIGKTIDYIEKEACRYWALANTLP